MRARMVRIAFAIPLACGQASGVAQTSGVQPIDSSQVASAPVVIVNNGDIVFKALADRKQDLTQPKLGNGSVADTKQWPASVVSLAGGMGRCTATLIGPQALLTAAHCVGEGATATIQFEDGTKYTGTCRRHPDWSLGNLSPDWALCLMTAVDRKGMFFEHIASDPALHQPGMRLTLGGFGCTDLESSKEEDPAVFRIGTAAIDKLPNTQTDWPNWMTTKAALDGGSSFVCPGDSGGAVYAVRADGVRRIVAVNSAVGADKRKPDYKVSYLSALSSPAFLSFLEWWRRQAKVPICGVAPNPPKCRPAPP